MFNIRPYRDLMNPDSENRKKIKGYIVTCGYACSEFCWCKHAKKCRYRSRYRWHNFSVSVSTFLRRKFNIKFHFPVYFQKHRVDLSGTVKCPYDEPRHYTCWNCKYCSGGIDGDCLNERRHELIKEGKADLVDYPYSEHKRRCKMFEPNDFYCDYDINTGEML